MSESAKKIQKNPYQLVFKQHIFPSASIARFCDVEGKVTVKDIRRGISRQCGPRDSIFCAKRLWDHRAETGYMRDIESDFQELASRIIDGSKDFLEKIDGQLVSRFFALWNQRQHYFNHPLPDMKLRLLPGRVLQLLEEERLEAAHIVFCRGNIMPSRFMTGIQIQRGIDMHVNELAVKEWGILRSDHHEFLVPDAYRENVLIPVSPTVVLAWGLRNALLKKQQVAQVNQVAIRSAKHFIFARNFRLCPSTVWR